MHPNAQAVIGAATASAHMLLQAARHVPEDKRNWSPGGKATSVYGILAHCTSFPKWMFATIEAGGMAGGDGEPNTVGSMEEAEAEMKAALGEFAAYVEGLPAEKWDQKIVFPWEETTVGGVLGYFEWNNTYHMGQVNYIQLLLGDEEMHF